VKIKSISRIGAALVLAFMASAPLQAEALSPDRLVQSTADEVFEVLRGDGDTTALAGIVDTKVVNHFDFGAMTRLAVGKHWRAADDAQREALTTEFRTLLVRTYSVALKSFVDYQIEYRPVQYSSDGRQAIVQTLVSKDGGKPVQMDYRMLAYPDDWKVYDVLVGGVSLVVNYRSLFSTTVERSGIDGLVSLLREKNAAGLTE
jgi:phospholipid transport system substrate-binding protein